MKQDQKLLKSGQEFQIQSVTAGKALWRTLRWEGQAALLYSETFCAYFLTMLERVGMANFPRI